MKKSMVVQKNNHEHMREDRNSILALCYVILFAGSLVALNPWGESITLAGTGRAEIWTFPKVFIVVTITVFNLSQVIFGEAHVDKKNLKDPKFLKAIFLWLVYLSAAAISTLLSPLPIHSLLGQLVLFDGLLYRALIAIFFGSNVLLLKLRPELFKAQLLGFLIGGSFLSLSIFPQILDWRIDYTINSGLVSSFDNQLLVSSIWRIQMPIGLYSNRGHAAFVLASVCSLSIVALWQRHLSRKFCIACIVLSGTALMATQVRAAIAGLLISTGYLLLCRFKRFSFRRFGDRLRHSLSEKKVLIACLAAIVIFLAYKCYSVLNSAMVLTEDSSLALVEKVVTGRLFLWSVAWQGILERPLIGWGFNGFGIAHLFVGDWTGRLSSYIPDGTSIVQLLSLDEATFDFLSDDGRIYVGTVLTHKAHNLFFDTLLSTGVCGLVVYIALLSYCLLNLAKSDVWPFINVAIIYLVFTQTWFEAAQFSHIPWWVLSIGIATPKRKDL